MFNEIYIIESGVVIIYNKILERLKSRKFKKIILVIFQTSLYIFALMPPDKVMGVTPGGVAAHLVSFVVLTVLYGSVIIEFAGRDFYLAIFAIPFMTGVTIELLQLFFPYRSFSVVDIGVDVVGIIIGMVFVYLLKRTKHL